jgi:hypothetical protein
MREEVMRVNRIFVASAARLTRKKLSFAATFVIIASFITTPVFAATLVAGSVYFDSEQTLKEVITLSKQHDNEGIAQLIKAGHISDQTQEAKDIVVLISGSTPGSPVEFSFLSGPTTYWTMTENVTNFAKPIPTTTPLPTPTPESTPLSKESPTPSSKRHNRQNENKAPFDDENGNRIWHQVDGKWKWYPANKRHVTDWPAAATLPAPAAKHRVSPSPAAALPAASPRPTPTPLIMNEGTSLYNSDWTQPLKNYRKPAGQ